MGVIVCKFGGTSTASADMFIQIKAILDENPDRRCVVLSAPGAVDGGEKITDLLSRAKRDDLAGGDAIREAAARFDGIAHGLGVEGCYDHALHVLCTALPVSEALLLSRGEYLCAELFSQWSAIPMVDAAALVRFDASGRIDEPATSSAFSTMSKRLPRMVVPGFYGSMPDGGVALLPRNGSDITGALAAAALRADLYENWTDVPGLMTADPANDPDARLIPSISYANMRRMAADGARVLHPDCLEPVARAGIPTRLCQTSHPERPGTMIS